MSKKFKTACLNVVIREITASVEKFLIFCSKNNENKPMKFDRDR